jgi:steroid 5-alpha reductase family enzyme
MRSLANFLLMVGVCVPPALYVAVLHRRCPAETPTSGESGLALARQWLAALPADASSMFAPPSSVACDVYASHPRLCVNLIYFVVVDVGFYLIYLLQGSTWLIDPHWQLIPVCISLFFFSHPDAGWDEGVPQHPRAYLVLGLLLVWATRLMHNYLRREGYQFGDREDWRYNDMRREHGRWFVISQFFAVCVAQHCMLVGLTMPLQPAMAASGASLNRFDALAASLCLTGICVGLVADNQLFAYMQSPDKPLLLDSGLWRFSRHPNHFGEQLWWIGILSSAVAAAGGWSGFVAGGPHCWAVAFGVCFNHPIDTLATLPLIEARMLRRPERATLYRAYQRRTPLLAPWFVRGGGKDAKVA